MAQIPVELEENQFRVFYAQRHDQLKAACEQVMRALELLLKAAPGLDISKVEGRVKDVDECIRKFRRKYRAALEERNTPYEIQHWITDLIGVRVVCLYEDELEKVAQLVRSHFDVIEVTDKVAAVESTETEFGYKGLHMDLRFNATQAALSENQAAALWPFELQIRTIIQDSWSVLDHKIKYKKSIPSQLKRRINVLSALFELADREFLQIRDATAAELLQAPDETATSSADPGEPEVPRPSRQPQAGSELNAFTFLKIANHFFKDFDFEPGKVDSFVADIQTWQPGMTRSQFNELLRHTIGTVKRYKQHFEEQNPQGSFNPFTVIRHCLYLGQKTQFRPALRNAAREAFEAWLQENPV
ncbi:(p)ppGpp synthetase [Acidovorax sp. DW039]|uniref:GTP pyrophosphokinase n=1 Tax=Acidovorax sp. DW039 TaxID=3095606 RepID=UPI00308E57C6|nr:(p)ppGpp synthetase [Acidovorax sp. DW039]